LKGEIEMAVQKLKLVECQSCSGEGEYLEQYDTGFGNTESIWVQCLHCDGEGKVEEDDTVNIQIDFNNIIEYNKFIEDNKEHVVSSFFDEEYQMGFVVISTEE
jgi:PKD repeat protein